MSAKTIAQAAKKLLRDLTCHCDKELIPLKNIDGSCARCNRKTFQSKEEMALQAALKGSR